MNDKVVLEAVKINKTFRDPVSVRVLSDISFVIRKGEFVSVTGKSGCGKSTLLYILSTMDTAYDGDLFIEQQHMRNRTERELAAIRNARIGFVFQFHYLLKEFSVLDNVMLPGLKLGRYAEGKVKQRAMDLLHRVGIAGLAEKMPNQLSGGEKQRVAIVRAMINDPAIIICDEPTGNLDKTNSQIVFGIFKSLAETAEQSLLIVTHDLEFARKTDRIIEMEDGRIVTQ